ncbi:hypothetical protein DJ71_16520, partial [Halorubrum sp. E3]
MDKMLVDSGGSVVVTNDGVTILKEMDIDHPAANMIVEVSETQEEEVGDGTTSAVVVAGELLDQAEELLDQDIHATTLAQGYRQAAEKAKEILDEEAIDVSADDRDTLVADLDAVREDLGDWSGVLDSHLAHRFDVDRLVVLRCRPETIESRLETRGESPETAAENAESEALDVILSEAVAEHGVEDVYEVDATDRDPEAVADAIRAAIEG